MRENPLHSAPPVLRADDRVRIPVVGGDVGGAGRAGGVAGGGRGEA